MCIKCLANIEISQPTKTLLVKFSLSEKARKVDCNLPLGFDVYLKFGYSQKATKFEKNLPIKDFFKFCVLIRISELYQTSNPSERLNQTFLPS